MSEVIQRTIQDVEQIAADLGLVPFLPTTCELFIDIDGEMPDDRMISKVLMDNDIHVQSSLITESVSGNHHKYLRIGTALSTLERIIIQAAMGSDPVKETLSMLRCRMAGMESAIALFETEKEAKKVVKWRKACG